MLRKVRTFWSLGPSGRAMAFESLAFPGLIRMGFRCLGVARTQSLLRRWALMRAAGLICERPDEMVFAARRSQAAIKRATGIEGTCLVRSMLLWAMLLRRGVETDLRFGVRKLAGRIEGHAWLERGGVILNEDEAVVSTYSIYRDPVSFDHVGQAVPPVPHKL